MPTSTRRSSSLTPTPAVAAALLLLLPADPGRAQPISVEGTAHLGVLTPATELLDSSGISGGGASLDATPAFGATAGLRFSSGFGVEVSAVRSFDAKLSGSSLTGEAAFSALTGHLTYRIGIPVVKALVAPYFGLGAGTRSLDFEDAFLDGDPDRALVDQDDLTGVALVGVETGLIPLLPFGFRAEVRDYVSEFEAAGQSNLQHDLTVLAGLSVSLP